MKKFNSLARLTLILAFCVILLGAYVRLSDAGLGCPDWPGCYGEVLVPESGQQVDDRFERALVPEKAWKEMIHRYLASSLGFLILVLAVLAFKNRDNPDQPVVIPFLLVGLVIFQGMLGMWTVTLLLKPAIVTAHLLGGMTTLALLTWLVMATREKKIVPVLYKENRLLLPLTIFAMMVLFVQIFLGGWTSSNYAALICPDFPTCQNHWWPAMDFGEAYRIWREVGVDYEYGILKADARTAIHMTHRFGALVTFITIIILAITALKSQTASIRKTGLLVALFLMIQVALGITNIVKGLPLYIAVAHNGMAALLLMSLTMLLSAVKNARKV